ncbi:MAG: Rrf2 family transcriptional regulator [Anaerolineales bacterium]|nr:Rrf2 family transcriptional regulator [Anaerolineales bacterium]
MSYSLAFSQAIMAVLYVADKLQQGIYDFVPTKQLSEDLSIAGPTAVKILQSLNRVGLIETREGTKGGIRLAVPASDITILDIFNAIENERPLFRSDLQVRATGEKPARARQEISKLLASAEEAMKDKLKELTVKDLLDKLNS